MKGEGFGEDAPASALTGGVAVIGVILSSVLSDDCKRVHGRVPQAGLHISTNHQMWDVSLPTPFAAFTTLPTLCPGSQHVTWKLFQPLLSPAWAGCGAGSFRPARGKSKHEA